MFPVSHHEFLTSFIHFNIVMMFNRWCTWCTINHILFHKMITFLITKQSNETESRLAAVIFYSFGVLSGKCKLWHGKKKFQFQNFYRKLFERILFLWAYGPKLCESLFNECTIKFVNHKTKSCMIECKLLFEKVLIRYELINHRYFQEKQHFHRQFFKWCSWVIQYWKDSPCI